MAQGKDGTYDFFVSRRGSAAVAAREVAEVLGSAGYTSFSQDYDIGHGANFIAEIHKALKTCKHFIALLTHDYDERRILVRNGQISTKSPWSPAARAASSLSA